MVKNKDRWSALSMSERAEVFKIGVKNGITNRKTIIDMYNSFGEGGPIEVDEYGYPADITPSIIEADYPREAEVWKRADASNADMVQRLKQGSSRATIQDWEDPRMVATHKMMSAGNYVVGNVQNINGQLFDFTDPKHGFEDPGRAAIDSAIKRGDYVEFDTEGDARYFAEHYKKHYNSFASGDPIKTDDYGYPADITPAIVTQDAEFNKFLMTLPDNQRLTSEEDYHTYLSWKLNGKPKTFQEAVDNDLMYSWDDSDNSYHGHSVAYDESTDTYYGLKPLHHSTASLDYDTWYQKGIHTLPGGKQVPLEGEDRKEWEDFRKNYNLVFEGNDYKYVPRKSYNRFDTGGPTREMTPLEAAALNKTLNNSQYMLAVGDSPDDPAYLSTDVLEPAVVKAFNSEEDYNRYQGEKFGEYVSNEISEAGTKLAPVLVGAAAAPWAISGGIAAYTNPITRSIIDLAGSIDGIRNAASNNGIRKTIRLAKEGDVWGTTKSAVGDIFDIAGGIGLAGDVYRYGKKASKSALLKNSGKIRDFAKGLSKNFKYALRSKQPIRFIWNNGNIIQNDFPKELLSEDAWYRIVGNGMRNKHFSDVYGAIADARNSGVVRTTRSKSIFKSPMFKKGIPFWDIQDNKALIVSNPDSDLDWVSVDYIGELNPTIPLEKNNFVGTPLYKGEPNNAPSSMFTYWRKYPFIGWRNMPLHYEKGGFLNTFEEGGPKDTKHVEDVVRTTRGATGRILTRDFPWVDVMGAKHLWDSWRVMRGNNKKVAPSDDNYTGTAMKGVGVQTDDGLGFVSQQDLANVLGYTPKDFVDTYVYGDTPFEELGVFKKETSPERHVVRSKVKKVEDSGKQVNTYQTQRDTLDTNTVAALDSLLNAGLVDLRSENTTYQKSPFNIGDSGIIYDGNNSTIATAYLPNGMPVSKAIDVFDTDPKEWNYKVGPLAKTGLSFIHDNTNPFLMTTPWYYPIKSTDFLSRLYYLFGIEADPEYNVISNKGDKNGVVWDLHEALEWLDSHPDLTEMPVKTKKD